MNVTDNVVAQLAAVERENEMLRAEIALLRAALGSGIEAPLEFRLTNSETRIFGALMKREVCTKEMLLSAVYIDLTKDEPEKKIIDVFICKLRKKLAPWKIQIGTIWGRGYQMPAASKQRVAAIMDAAKQPMEKDNGCDDANRGANA